MSHLSHIEGFSIRDGRLFFSGVDTVELAKEYGTPLWVLSEDIAREKCRRYVQAFRSHGVEATVAYAGKAFLTTGFCGLLDREGMGLDVCSGGELHTASAAGFPMERVLFHGNNKTPGEIELALELGVSRFVVDNLYELRLLDELAGRAGKVQPIFFRATPGINTHTHHHIQTGHLDTKFGFGIENGQAEEAIRIARGLENVRLVGLHCHIGSQLFDLAAFRAGAWITLDFIGRLRDLFPGEEWELDLGGGLGIRYSSEDYPPSIEEYVGTLCAAVREKTSELGMPMPRRLWIEPGRSIVAPAGLTLYTVGAVKPIPGIRTYIAVDGSMADHPRTALYGSIYTSVLANKAGRPPAQAYSVAGKACESGDMIIYQAALSEPEPGDLLAVFCTGAYHYSMSSNYNRLPRPAVVGLAEGRSRLLVRRETFSDLLRNDFNPYRSQS
ncbi:MAG TPA: diaminopimelate decarboxylase [Candidatus Ozemobacteraceae bacterium]|nr:diaminopimelate decarboxylase [Candidatus Ozemobacteraceae bacterium]